MDNTDREILKLLGENSRMSAAEIGRTLHMSVPAITERIRKLEAEGVILGYGLNVDRSKLGATISAYIFIGFESSRLDDDIREYISSNSEIVECSFITGDYDYLMKVAVKDPASLTRLIHQLKGFKKVSRTRTIVVLEDIKGGK